MKTISEVREAFWKDHPSFDSEYSKRKRQNEYNATIRSAFVEYVDYLSGEGLISDSLANRVTL